MRISMIVVCLALTACGVSTPDGLTLPQLPALATEESPHPSEFLGAGDWELIAGRIGDALLQCEAGRALAVGAYQDAGGAL
jgi:hypothetical protein